MKFRIVLLTCLVASSVASPSLAQIPTTVQPSPAVTRDSVASETSHDPVDWPQVGMGFSTAIGNLFYIPAKIAYGTLGGLAGGAAYVFTRGDHHVAHKIWHDSLGGDYVLSPTMLKGQEPIHFVGSSLDSTQVDDKAPQHSARLVQAFPPRGEASLSAGAVGTRSVAKAATAERDNSASLEIPRAEHASVSAQLNPRGIRSSSRNQESVPQFNIVPQ
jgi:hypothetical protein